jgi:hypothetical protein
MMNLPDGQAVKQFTSTSCLHFLSVFMKMIELLEIFILSLAYDIFGNDIQNGNSSFALNKDL